MSEGGSPQSQESRAGPRTLLTAADLVARWQVSEGQVYNLTRRGLLAVVRVGRYYRYRLDAIERWELGGGVADE